MGWIMGWIMRWIMRNDQWKKTMNIKKWQGNTLIDVTGYAFCHCQCMRALIGSTLVGQTNRKLGVSLQQGTIGEGCFWRRRELEMAPIAAAKLLIPPAAVADR
jgi:hypothetical protein